MITDIALEQNTATICSALWHSARFHRFPIALWRLPFSSAIHVIVNLAGEVANTKVDLEELPAGFAFSPFLNPDGTQTRFIRANVHYVFQDGQLQEINLPEKANAGAEQALWRTANEWLKQTAAVPSEPASPAFIHADEPARFKQLVADAVAAIQAGDFQKVVLARTKEVALSPGWSAVKAFKQLCITYSQAFVSLVHLPGEGDWMGASPETLISVDEQQTFRTVSLAGTQPAKSGISANQAVWTQKEIEEQALVSRYIVNCFKKIRLREYDEVGPRTVIAGNLMHLRTDFTVDMQATHFPQLGTVMLELLHPTSAVCGMPKEPALAYILHDEGFDRQFYSGFLGPVNIAGGTHLYVNLRCVQLMPDKAILYAGAGITANSEPEKEWAETELKCQTLLEVLK